MQKKEVLLAVNQLVAQNEALMKAQREGAPLPIENLQKATQAQYEELQQLLDRKGNDKSLARLSNALKLVQSYPHKP